MKRIARRSRPAVRRKSDCISSQIPTEAISSVSFHAPVDLDEQFTSAQAHRSAARISEAGQENRVAHA